MTDAPEQFLRMSAHFLTDRYHGAEWPPSPARAYQALIAGVMTGHWRDTIAPASRDALLWLERLPAPWICAQSPAELSPYQISVPNNDLDNVARAWAKGQSADAAKLRTMKEIRPRRFSRDETQVQPSVHYLWPLESDSSAADASRYESALRAVSHCLHTLGWGVDMAFADVAIERDYRRLEGEVWKPGPKGKSLAVPIEGFLEDLEQAYSRFKLRVSPHGVNADTRARVYGEERYAREFETWRTHCAFALRVWAGQDSTSDAFYRHPARKTAEVAAWLRHAAISAIDKHPNLRERMPYVSGHVTGDDKSDRLSYVPLPSIGVAKTDGWIRRAMLVEAPGSDGEVTRHLSQALLGLPATNEKLEVVCQWGGLSTEDPVLRSYLPSGNGTILWETVTPMLLHGHNMQRGQLCLKRTSKLLREAFDKAGYPDASIEEFFIQAAPLVPQLPAAGQFFLPEHLRKWPRYHVGIRFKQPVQGPLLAGIGRHYGLGLFRPVARSKSPS